MAPKIVTPPAKAPAPKLAQRGAAPAPVPAKEPRVRGPGFSEDLIGDTVNFADVEMRARRSSAQYDGLIGRVQSLKVGQAIALAVPEGGTIEKYRATVSATLRKKLNGVALAGGKGRLSIRESSDGRLLVGISPNVAK